MDNLVDYGRRFCYLGLQSRQKSRGKDEIASVHVLDFITKVFGTVLKLS